MAGSAVGNGPPCPVDPSHGRTYDYRQKTSHKDFDWWCPHSAHGGNGKFFTDKEAHGEYQLEERDLAVIYEGAAHDVIAEKITLDQAVQNVARATQRPSSQVREALVIMIDAIKEKDTDMAEKQAAAKAAKAAKSAPKPPGERRRLEHVDGSEFERVKNELGLTNKQAAEATGAAGMGASSTYIYIVTHSGSSAKLFAKYEAALRKYAKENKIKAPKPGSAPDAEASAPEPKTAPKKAAPAKAAAASKAAPAKAAATPAAASTTVKRKPAKPAAAVAVAD